MVEHVQNVILNYTATITSAATDETPMDNTFTLNQTVVNSYDPNDKTCLEGATIAPSEVGKYVHYMIRFENTGTFPAEDIVVKDMIDTNKFDISSLVPIKGIHSFVTNITSGNKVEFIFENINLPFDDANNDGYVAFKIKTKPTLVVGNTFSNSASIYFDYNFPIVTNTAVTTIQALSTQDFSFGTYFTVYPNPVKDVLNIETKQTIEVSSISIYNQLGQLVLVVPSAQHVSKVDVSNLAAGNYFIKINSDKGTSNTRFIKQ
ncbi:T9SS type A sorting domain-containing protein [Flavobacterium saliperosum]|uniref:T9SS type A sorting domain-containing protein n=1 Tax=Flavobacterium saliperosum TaxID=329186 RepID=UPI001EE32C8C|nr:T9SS type A sorting domain-containing protein [Flavobacterium saliperosum]